MRREVRATILTWPCGMVRPEIILWLAATGVPIDADHVDHVCESPHAAALNHAIECALASPFDRFVFIENDLLCDPTDLSPFWSADADVVCARYGSPRWWTTQTFHLGLWRTRREVLMAAGPPWVAEGEPGCLCASLARRTAAARFRPAVAGRALHMRATRCHRTPM